MRIVILGAGTVGTSIADMLCRHRHSVTVVDSDPDHTRRINDELDVRAIVGSASRSSILFQAEIIGCDICLAVTGNDEVNLIAGSMAKAMGARRSMARVYAPIFRDLSTFDYQRHFNIDRLLSLEHLSAMEFAHHIRTPGSVVLEHFARGEVEVQEITVSENTHAVGTKLKDLDLPPGLKVGSINRESKMWLAGAEDQIEVGDHVTLIGERDGIDQVKSMFRISSGSKMSVVIAGGGETGYHLARTLEGERYKILLMDASEERCEYLADHLKHTTVIHADATRRSVLEEERVASADVFVACTGDDENNIMAGVEARDIGTEKIMALVGRPDYANVVNKLGIDVAVSERQVMAKQILGFLNKGAVVSRVQLPGGRISIFEIDVVEGALATEHVLANVPFPAKCLIAAVIRGEYVSVPGADDRLQAGDTVVALIDDSVVEEALAQFELSG